jgi:hypothetical protein
MRLISFVDFIKATISELQQSEEELNLMSDSESQGVVEVESSPERDFDDDEADFVPAKVAKLSFVAPPASEPKSRKRARSTKEPLTPLFSKSLKAPASEPPAKKQKKFDFIKPEAPAGANPSDVLVKTLYSGDKFVGRFKLPILSLSPASLAQHYCTREMVEEHVLRLVDSMSSYTSGFEVRDNFKVALCFTSEAEEERGKMKLRVTDLLKQSTVKARRTKIQALIDEKLVNAITIGGNHSREALTRLINQNHDHFPKDFEVTCDVFIDPSVEEARAIGFVDNTVASANREYSFQDKVILIRELWMNPKYVTEQGLGLTNAALTLAVNDYLSNNKGNTSFDVRLNSSSAFIKACNIPEDLWEVVKESLSSKSITMAFFRSINWSFSPARLRCAFVQFNKDANFKVLQNVVKSVKAYNRAVTSILWIWRKLDSTRQIASSDEDFLVKFSDILNIDTLAQQFSSSLQSLRGTTIFQDDLFTVRVKRVIEGLLHPSESRSQIMTGFAAQPCLNRDGIESLHYLRCSPLEEGVQAVKAAQFKIGTILLDPPFGIISESWDTAWTMEEWVDALSLLHQNFPAAPLVVWMAFQQQKTVEDAASLSGYHKISYHCWLKTGSMTQRGGRMSYPANPFLILTQDKKKYQPNSTFKAGTNFVATPPEAKFRVQEEVLNPTQKPVVLLRSVINSFCPVGSTVLDVCSGSGSGAIASATLGFDSISIDFREDQIEGATQRLQGELNAPSYNPSCDFIHDFSTLRRSLTEQLKEPAAKESQDEAEESVHQSESNIIAEERALGLSIPSNPSEVMELLTSSPVIEEERSDDEAPTPHDNDFIDDSQPTQRVVRRKKKTAQTPPSALHLPVPKPPSKNTSATSNAPAPSPWPPCPVPKPKRKKFVD